MASGVDVGIKRGDIVVEQHSDPDPGRHAGLLREFDHALKPFHSRWRW
jgi:hypothetical protein